MDIVFILIIIISLAIIFWIAVILIYSKKKWLSKEKKKMYIDKLNKLESVWYEKKIINYDSILSKILNDLWYKWMLGEQLKKNPWILTNDLQSIWDLHKLRNKLAHEVEEIDQNLLKKKSDEYKRILEKILN